MPRLRQDLPAAVLFDMDGTIVDTEPYWMDAEVDLVASHGGRWTHEDGLLLVGRALLDSAEIIIERTGIPLTPRAVVESLLCDVAARMADQVPWRPGAQELLHECADRGVPTALVTMSWTTLTDVLLAATPRRLFDVVVTGDKVTHGKPHPEPYLLAAQRLGLPPERAVAIEDSETGARSATAAGCRTIVVPHVVPVPPLPGAAQVDSLSAITLADLHRIAPHRDFGHRPTQ